MKRNYYNATTDTMVKFTGEQFVVIGEGKVSNKVLMAMFAGETPEGWELAPVI